jgi:dTDP-6-deoxy-L-talose 4-dehydrogenase (NAD+)
MARELFPGELRAWNEPHIPPARPLKGGRPPAAPNYGLQSGGLARTTTIAVTGASGFVGRHVLAALARTDATIVAHARTPRPDHVSTARQRWIYFDLAGVADEAFERLGRPDIVIHLAWGGLPNYLSLQHFEIEFPAQHRFLRALVTAGLGRLVVTGTCFEYGIQSGCLNEGMTPLPSNPYGTAKDTLRKALDSLSETIALDLRWLRLFYLYGSGQAPTSLYSQFRAAVVRGNRRFDMSVGDQMRDFMKVEDAAAAIADIALRARAPRILNICSGAPTSVRNIVERWRKEMGADIELNIGVLPYPHYEPFAFWGDDSRLCELLGRAAFRLA